MSLFAIMLIGLAALVAFKGVAAIARCGKSAVMLVVAVGIAGLLFVGTAGGMLALWSQPCERTHRSERSYEITYHGTRPTRSCEARWHRPPRASESFVATQTEPRRTVSFKVEVAEESEAKPAVEVTDEVPDGNTPAIAIDRTETSRPPATGDRVTTEPRPAWVDEPAQLQGAVYQQVVHAGPHPRRLEAENELEELIAQAIDDYLDEAIRPGAAELVTLPSEFVKEHVVQEEFTEVHRRTFGTLEQEVYMVDLYTRLEFGPEVREEAKHRYRTEVVEDRLWIAGAGLAGMLALLGSVFGYLRVDDATGGKRRGRLRFVAGGAILTIIAAGVLIARWAPWV